MAMMAVPVVEPRFGLITALIEDLLYHRIID